MAAATATAKTSNPHLLTIPITLLLCLQSFCYHYSLAADTITQGGPALRSSSIILSSNGLFTLGFQRLESNGSFLGIWYANDTSAFFWVANRVSPVPDDSGALALDPSGTLNLNYSGGHILDLYSPATSAVGLTAQLQDTGNFSLFDSSGTAC